MEGSYSNGPGGRFEDEKKRIIESCFSKKDEDGALQESYITHIRIMEDAAHPSSPPPPNANPANKKPRLIIVAVRKSGRVRMHKARENANGSFSIGKTWVLDDVSAVQSYNGMVLLTVLCHLLNTITIESGPGSAPPYTKLKIAPRGEIHHVNLHYEGNSSRERMQRQMSPGGPSSVPSQTSQDHCYLGSVTERRLRGQHPVDSDRTGPGPSYGQANLRRLAGAKSESGFICQKFQDRNSTFSGGRDAANDVPPVPAPLAIPPERRRPPMPIIGDSRQLGQDLNDDIVPAPLASPGMRREDLRLPVRSSERSNTRDRELDKAIGPAPAVLDIKKPEPPQPTVIPPAIVPPQLTKASTPVQTPQEEELENNMRPGLGPMIKKQTSTVTSPKKSKADVANSFLKAAKSANSFNSFKPRAGGAAERLREAAARAEKSPDGPDALNSEAKSTAASPAATPVEKASPPKANNSVPEVKITVPQSDRPSSIEGPVNGSQETAVADKQKPKEPKRPKAVSEIMQKELASIGVDPSILGGRGGDLVAAWEEFGWVGDGVHAKNIDQMKEEIERELNRVQAGGWLTRLDEEDERIAAVHAGLDKCIAECDELDGLLTLYLVELSTRNEDVAYIEAQSQGLQVQAANQKLLQAELKSLLSTISISSEQLSPLREASLESSRGLEQIEGSLVTLFRAMLSIDPTLSASEPRASEDGSLSSGRPGGFSTELGSMRVMQEKKEVYKSESAQFLRRLKPFLQVKFAAAIDETRKALEREKDNQITKPVKVKLDSRNHDLAREVLWKYSPLMLFTREVDRQEWEDLLKNYEMVARPLYQDEFRDTVFAWKRVARKPTGDEGDVLFTSQVEKQTEGIATTARKLTVKRSQTLAKSLRSPIGENGSRTNVDRGADGRLLPYEVFSGVLDEMIPIVSMEQNFIAEFFHITSFEQQDFPESVAATVPDMRRGTDLRRTKVMDPNRDLAKQVVMSMEEVYGFFPDTLQALVEWTIQADPLQGVGLIVTIERKLLDFEESNQEFLARTFQKLHGRLVGLFTKFLDEQIRAIEETKVKIKKRKGVIGFVKIFPSFSTALETMLISADGLEIRETVNDAYHRINKAMFESLKVIARENPGAQTAGADPEDKEALNYQILLIENMNHYLEEVETKGNPALEDWKQNAAQEMDEHMSLYVGAVIRRPLGKLLDFLESTESLVLSRQPGEPASKISGMPSHSKITFKKVLAGYDSKEIRKGIETLRKRVEKHFGDADDPTLSRGLVAKVQQHCQEYYEKVEDRILTISRDVYDGDIVVEWTRADVSGAFKK
ncbi:exocyst complex component Sec3-domain-containing protein [Bisporella sp. PMI_857]|nr:exocyst complex component Sec3-domain-containing protein [Bisporella sp. PMI_857]